MADYIQKHASEIKNYTLDWTPKGLGTDTISSATFTFAPNGITITNITGSGTTSACTISGGAVGINYTIFASISTAGSQTFDETIYCFVEP